VQFVGYQSGRGAQILVDKVFDCGNGHVDVLLRSSLDFSTCDTVGTWSSSVAAVRTRPAGLGPWWATARAATRSSTPMSGHAPELIRHQPRPERAVDLGD